MSLFSPKSQAIISAALREFLEPPDDEPLVLGLPDHGVCPGCRKDLEWDGVDDTVAWCSTTGCEYDRSLTEDENRIMFAAKHLKEA